MYTVHTFCKPLRELPLVGSIVTSLGSVVPWVVPNGSATPIGQNPDGIIMNGGWERCCPWLSVIIHAEPDDYPLPSITCTINMYQLLSTIDQLLSTIYQLLSDGWFSYRILLSLLSKKSLLGGWDDFPIRYLSPSSPKPGWTSQRIFCRWFTWPTSWACWSETWHWRRGRR